MPPDEQKKKILYIITQPEWGGAQRYVFDLATSLKNDFDITVATGRVLESKKLIDELEKENIKTEIFHNLVRNINPWSDFLAFLEIVAYLNANKFDIVHLNSSKAGVIGAAAANLHCVKKIIYTAHGWVFNEPLPFWKKKFYKIAERFSAKSTTKIITLSQIDTEIGIMEKIAPAKKFKKIYHGIKKINFLEKDEARLKINEKFEIQTAAGAPLIGGVANFYETKGLKYLISAWPEVIKSRDNAKLIIFGDGTLRKKLEAQINKLNITKSVFLPGELPDASRYLKMFDVFVLPSVKEGLPYAILEAMQSGRPIVATRVGGIPEMIEDQKNGLLVSPADPDELAQAITRLIDNKELASTLSQNAQQTLEQKFSFEKMVAETRNVYLNQDDEQ